METVLACITFLKIIYNEGVPMQKWLKLNFIFNKIELFLKVMLLGVEFKVDTDASLLAALHFKHRYIV